MKILSTNAVDEEFKQFIRDWVVLLANGNYQEALSALCPEITDNGNAVEWTPKLLESIISNLGSPKPLRGANLFYCVAPVDESLREEFEKRLRVERIAENQWRDFSVRIEVDLPLVAAKAGSVAQISDLTAIFYSIPVSETKIAFVLQDIHVL